jgi:hypothetical protein
MWTMWEDKISGDSETKNWMMANTKPCPKCSEWQRDAGDGAADADATSAERCLFCRQMLRVVN